jgi:hypothetical protein
MTASEEDIDDLYEEIQMIDKNIERYENEIITSSPDDCKKYEICIKKLKNRRNDCVKILEMIYKKT